MEVRLELDIEGESLEKVREISAEVADKLTTLPTLSDVKSLMEENRPEIHINIDQKKALEKKGGLPPSKNCHGYTSGDPGCNGSQS